jgi:hypothetical protein
MRLALRGAVIVVGGTLLALLLFASSLEALRFSTPAIIGFRVAIFAVFAGLVGYALIRPSRRKVSDSQVAMYLEEYDTTLQTAILSAVETRRLPPTTLRRPSPVSSRSRRQAIEQSAARWTRGSASKTTRQAAGDRVRQRRRWVALLIALGRHICARVRALIVTSARKPHHIDVKPGNTAPRNSDQTISAASRLRRQDASLPNRPRRARVRARCRRPPKDPQTWRDPFHREKSTANTSSRTA